MRKIIASMACLAFVFCAAGVAAQTTGTSTLSSKDANKADAHDRPIGGINIKLPAPTGTTQPPAEPPPAPPAPPPPAPPSEGEDMPPVETPPDPPPPEDPPTYYGEPVQGKFAFVLDASGSMYGSRIATVRAETTATIGDLTEDDEFDCVAYGSQFPVSQDYSKFMWGTLLPGSDGNKSSAITWVNGPSTNPGGGTPTYACLKKSCQVYPADLDKMFLLTDGYPNVSGSSSQILADFPTWWAKFEDCELICVCIGGGGASFMQQLAALAGGTYVAA
ncbi:MAG: VWA domain-containing protein [Planctomycetes bacterium]|nr:VWA domain-containing protein [Planctomycetota bacterium]MCB9935754.1 VWA domain-containing protein [Planctomycetota bacterium]